MQNPRRVPQSRKMSSLPIKIPDRSVCVVASREKFLPPPRGPHNKRKHKFRRLSPSLRVVPPRRCKKLAARATLATKALFFRLPPFVHAGIHPLLLLSRKGQREKADPDAVRFNLKLFKRGDSSFNSARPAERETKSTATVFHSHYVFTVCHRVEGGRRERERVRASVFGERQGR